MRVKIGTLLSKNSRRIDIEEDTSYKQVTIRRWNKGVTLRKIESGDKIKTKKQFIVRENDFIFCKLNAHSGALGFVSEGLDGAVVTSDFPSFTFDKTVVIKEWFEFFISSKEFNEICKASTSGSAQSRIQIPTFLNSVIDVPTIGEQKAMVEHLKLSKEKHESIQSSSDSLLQDLTDFRKEILNRAFHGELTEQNFADGTGQELLVSIQLKKQQQYEGTKLKKKLELAPVEAGEEAYDLPENWMWTRFGEFTLNHDGKRIPLSQVQRTSIEKIYDYYGASGVIDKVDNFLFNEDLLLISEDGSNLVIRTKPIGFIAKGKYWVNNHAHVVDCIDKISLRYICYFINSIDLKPYITGTAQPKLNQANLNKIALPIPPLAEQHRIVEKIEAIFGTLDTMEQAILLQKAEASTCYDEILRKSLEGK